MVFAVFMESCLVGATLSAVLASRLSWRTEKTATALCVLAALALFATPYFESYEVRLCAFVVFEMCVGLYFPSIGALRGKYVPDSVRATIMNIFRIPLNVIVVAVLCQIDALGLRKTFHLAAALLIVGAGAAYALHEFKVTEDEVSSKDAKAQGNGI